MLNNKSSEGVEMKKQKQTLNVLQEEKWVMTNGGEEDMELFSVQITTILMKPSMLKIWLMVISEKKIQNETGNQDLFGKI